MALVSRSSETAKRPRYVPIICSYCSSSSLCSSKADTEAPSPIPLRASTVPISSRGCNGQSSLVVSKPAPGESSAGLGRTERFPICKSLCQCTDTEAVRTRFKFGMALLYYGVVGDRLVPPLRGFQRVWLQQLTGPWPRRFPHFRSGEKGSY